LKKKRAAAYVRVSTSRKNQIHSFEFQSDYWQREISKNPEYELCGIYSDKGISGKSIEKRPQFKAMLRDCLDGEIDIIFVKSVSRFARNLEELLETVRKLREKGVTIIFETENINTSDNTSEIYLSIAAALAQNDLNEYSKRQKGAYRYKYTNGIISVGNGIYGYTLTKDNELIKNEDEEKVIKHIFESYLKGDSIDKIKDSLDKQKIPTKRGKLSWQATTIRKMLSNEKYMGDSLLQKFVSINGEKQYNDGIVPSYYYENTHEPIISKEDFNKVQDLLKDRANQKLIGRKSEIYPFTGMIECEKCGKKYTHKVNNAGTKSEKAFWSCSTYLKQGKKICDNSGIKDEILSDKFIEAYNEFILNKYENNDTNLLKQELENLLLKERQLNALKVKGLIRYKDYENEIIELIDKIKNIGKQIKDLSTKNIKSKDYKTIEKFDEDKLYKFIKKVTVRNFIVTFHFINGVKIEKFYNNGKHGNINDWRKKKLEVEL